MKNHWLNLVNIEQASKEMEEYINEAYKGMIFDSYDIDKLINIRDDFLKLNPEYKKFDDNIKIIWYIDFIENEVMYVCNAVVKVVKETLEHNVFLRHS